ncbi:MAG: transposase, partial [Ignavibacteria bacterium]|nr:transposase [Ignavibacteria bacterium]
MTSKVNQDVKYLIISTLQNKVFSSLNKARKDFILNVLWHILSIKGKINFTQLGRFSANCEQTHRIHFEQE